MKNVEVEELKNKYNILKKYYYELKTCAKNAKSLEEEYAIKQELTSIILEISQIRKRLMDIKFGRFYPTTLLDNFIFGENREGRGI